MERVTSFRLEKDLLDVLRGSFADVLVTPPTRVLAETQIGNCIPDLLFIFDADNRARAPIELTYFDAAILAVLDGQPVELPALAEQLYSRLEELNPRLERLVRLGLVIARTAGTYAVRRGALPRDVRIIAVEAKLSRWRTAMLQAQEYLGFANESYIAMPAEVLRTNVAALDACARAGVGVIVVDSTSATVLLEAEKTQPSGTLWVRLVSNTVGLNHIAATRSNASRQAR